MQSEKVEKKLEICKKRLLDLGMNNRLLNYRETKSSSLVITTPTLSELYDLLVLHEKELTFARVSSRDIEELENAESISEEESSESEALVNRWNRIEIPGDVDTDKNVVELQKVLKNIRAKANTIKEEQGINTLYLSFGFLEWFESDNSSRVIRSPIVLVPVQLIHEGITEPYKMVLHEDEIVVNPTLQYKLEDSFAMELPPFDSVNQSIIEYLASVRSTVQKTAWNVSENVSLSLLSFMKISMYMDIVNHGEKMSGNEIIRAISGENDNHGDGNILCEYAGYDHDAKTLPINTFQVVDADSSQQDAVLLAKKGVSFVLQGPPGTGKSQTITNIIAEALADGKKILFVSEKMAALDVVYKRLTAVGLSDFCLVLHSSKANKKMILDSLKATAELPSITVKSEALGKLQELKEKRDRLNAYSTQLHLPHAPLNQTVYEANGIIAGLEQYPDIIFSLDDTDIGKLTAADLKAMRIAISDLAAAATRLSSPFIENIWNGCTISTLTFDLRQRLSGALKSVCENMAESIQKTKSISEKISFPDGLCYENISDCADFLRFCAAAPDCTVQLLDEERIPEIRELIHSILADRNQKDALQETIDTRYSRGIYVLQASEIAGKANEISSCLMDTWVTSRTRDDFLYEHGKEIVNVCTDAAETLEEEQSLLEDTADRLGMKPPAYLSQIPAFLRIVSLCDSDIRAHDSWFMAPWGEQYRNSAVQKVQNLIGEIKKLRDSILVDYEAEILSVDAETLYTRFITEYSGFFSRLSRKYKNDRNLIRFSYKGDKGRYKYEEAVRILGLVKKYNSLASELARDNSIYEAALGGWYCGEDTDFVAVCNSFDSFDEVNRYFKGDIPVPIRERVKMVCRIPEFDDTCSRADELSRREILPGFYALVQNGTTKSISELIGAAHTVNKLLNDLNNTIRTALSEAKDNYSFDSLMEDLHRVQEYKQVSTHINDGMAMLTEKWGDLFNKDTDLNEILGLLDWVEQYRELCCSYGVCNQFKRGIVSDPVYRSGASNLADELINLQSRTIDDIRWIDSLFELVPQPEDETIERIYLRNSERLLHLNELEPWLDCHKAFLVCQSKGLSSFVRKVFEVGIPSEAWESVFMKRFEHLWLDSISEEIPAVADFRGYNQEEVIAGFRKLDEEQLNIARARIREKLIEAIPDMNGFTSSADEIGILKREWSKQRRIMPIRKLFDRIPFLLPTLKPCLMMSPLSVSFFLQSNNYDFDMVIFDEASQVRTENAIGAISRGKQLIVAGDRHQLPPTNFFTSYQNDIDDYDLNMEETENTEETYESVLDELVTVIPELSLKWHYRSRDESLIAFSNAHIYDSSLVTFPQPFSQNRDTGVDFVYVENGLFDRGRKRCNQIEAERVAGLVFEEIKLHPDRSLGVIAFSEAQQAAVDHEVTKMRLANPSYEAFFAENKDDPFFIKNLENVQGDERDTIIFSIGYAKTSPTARLAMNFGPINREGGYRRLNVAITRARYSVKVVSSILSTDMEITETTPIGVKMLRDYLEYAKEGPSVLQNTLAYTTAVRTESPFEDSVYDFLIGKGYRIVTQVGCSGYRIDMAVEHPTLHGKFVLGIECDGATYHSSRTARERDRLRQTVLEEMGWKLYRIWSTDWIKDTVSAKAKLCQAIDKAIRAYGEIVSMKRQEELTEPKQTADSYTEQVSSGLKAPSDYGFDVFVPVEFSKTVYPMPGSKIAEHLKNLVMRQYPLHVQLAYEQLAPLYGLTKATDRLRNGVDYIIETRKLDGQWEKRGNYLWPVGQDKVVPRKADPDSGYKRNLYYVSEEELGEAMRIIVSKSFGITKAILFKTVCREYGFARTTNQMTEYLNHVYDNLLSTSALSVVEGKISLGKTIGIQ